jgi:hypothetical protein
MKLQLPYCFDFAAMRGGRIVSWVEVKCRTQESTTYPTLMVSAHKWVEGISYAKTTGLPFVLVVEFEDCIKYFKHDVGDPTDSIHLEWGGRTRTPRDRFDAEPVVHIPMELFKPIGSIRAGAEAA